MSSTVADVRDDGRQEQRVDAYTKFWQKDMSKEADVDNQNRLDSYTDVVNGVPSHQNLWIDAYSFFTLQVTMTAQPNYTSMVGRNRSTSRVSTKGNPSLPLSPVMSITSPPICNCVQACECLM